MSTIRQQIIDILQTGDFNIRELSQAVGVSERELYQHLPHVAKSVAGKKLKFKIEPAKCSSCGFIFNQRQRMNPPSRCPECKKSRIIQPRYKID